MDVISGTLNKYSLLFIKLNIYNIKINNSEEKKIIKVCKSG